MPLARSFLYVPANREKFLDKAIGLPADAFIFDLEDSVPPAEKGTPVPACANTRRRSRTNASGCGRTGSTRPRPRPISTRSIGVDGIAGLFLPKVETRAEVLRWDG